MKTIVTVLSGVVIILGSSPLFSWDLPSAPLALCSKHHQCKDDDDDYTEEEESCDYRYEDYDADYVPRNREASWPTKRDDHIVEELMR